MATLVRAVEVVPSSKWAAQTAVDRLVLTYDERHRRRVRYVALGGTTFLLDLPRAAVLRAGDGLRLEDGRMVSVEASPEQLVEVTASDGGTLVRLAWHIGNRHLPAQIEAQRILIRDDAVIVNMLIGLGASVRPVMEAFTPEAGAYDHANAAVATAEAAGPEPIDAMTTHAAHAHTHTHAAGNSHDHGHHFESSHHHDD